VVNKDRFPFRSCKDLSFGRYHYDRDRRVPDGLMASDSQSRRDHCQVAESEREHCRERQIAPIKDARRRRCLVHVGRWNRDHDTASTDHATLQDEQRSTRVSHWPRREIYQPEDDELEPEDAERQPDQLDCHVADQPPIDCSLFKFPLLRTRCGVTAPARQRTSPDPPDRPAPARPQRRPSRALPARRRTACGRVRWPPRA
jgi:hypothetical protein